ncbi:YveK family protein [Neobacillus massiliamazoniensis]|uniref:Lipopolysaccharide biosynthesis protein n=1 Tax=Neobacillus massiliamazoniensis TaxID=1499688 RepID=A0A0U1NUG4_9BACI|nr:Wzz/FepE/Etk N-terminal domain-containing protein [Neobacillus massiliamazoniensis]CRK81666.1 lipopolysaccharide biosynthesis protein [Neobacillus massiliamazoniensis]
MSFHNANKTNAKDINLKELFYVIKKRLWIVVVITFISTGLGTYYSYSHNTSLYQASSRIIIDTTPDYRNTLQVIIKDSTILGKVVKQLGLPQSPEALAGQITVTSIDNTQVVSIGVTYTDPKRAADIANTTATVFKAELPNIVSSNNVRDVSILSNASVNPVPINHNQKMKIVIALVIGGVIGIGLAFLLDSLDDTLRSNNEVEEILGLPVLGRVSRANKKNLKKKYIKHVNLEARGDTVGYK